MFLFDVNKPIHHANIEASNVRPSLNADKNSRWWVQLAGESAHCLWSLSLSEYWWGFVGDGGAGQNWWWRGRLDGRCAGQEEEKASIGPISFITHVKTPQSKNRNNLKSPPILFPTILQPALILHRLQADKRPKQIKQQLPMVRNRRSDGNVPLAKDPERTVRIYKRALSERYTEI